MVHDYADGQKNGHKMLYTESVDMSSPVEERYDIRNNITYFY